MRPTERIPLDALAEIAELKRELAELKTMSLQRIHNLSLNMVRAAFNEDYVGSANRINVTEAIEKTMTFVIPVAWNSWDVQIVASWTVFEDLTATGNTFIRFRIRKTNVSGDVWGANAQTYPDASPNDKSAAIVAHAEGQTDTGTVTFVWTADAAANSEIFAWDEFDLIAQVYRVT